MNRQILVGKFLSSLCLVSCLIGCTGTGEKEPRSRMSLEGNWAVRLDSTDIGEHERWWNLETTDSMRLPGTTDLAKIGPLNEKHEETFSLSREYAYVGKVWYSRKVVIPSEWEGRDIRLVMERTKPTTLWVDNQKIGQSNDISTAQAYDLSSFLTPGEHTITIRVDNGGGVPEQVINSSHAYSPSTQTNWNGVIGQFYLESRPAQGIEHVRILPDWEKKMARVEIDWRDRSSLGGKAELKYQATAWNTDKPHQTPMEIVEVDMSQPSFSFDINLSDTARCWSEFDPALYRLDLRLEGDGFSDETTKSFGLRRFEAKDKQFHINDKVTFLRGKHDACVFPLTAHTAMDVETWRHYFRVGKDYGINHWRFHSWCPPEACFAAADMEGIYLQPELPIWGHVEASDRTLMDFLLKEGRHSLEAYADHASFVMFGLGNEMNGDEGLAELLDAFKKDDPRPLYAAGSNNNLGFKGPMAGEDYYTACRVGGETPGAFDTHARASFSFADAEDGGYLNHTYPNTVMDFTKASELSPVPVISHETGQFQVYPNYAEMEKYTGVLKPWNMAVFKRRLEAAGMADQATDFMKASGAWAAILYRADMEMNLRTYPWGGFQLLDLQDYPGQGSAYVGVLDAFMDSKGLVTPEEWRQSCSEVVPLFITEKFCWSGGETLSGEVKVANYSVADLADKVLGWELLDNDQAVFSSGEFSLSARQGDLAYVGKIQVPMEGIKEAERLTLVLTIEGTGFRNSYPLWVYPSDNLPQLSNDILVARRVDRAMLNRLKSGGKVLLFPDHKRYEKQTVGGLFQTDYWNYRMFKTICENLGKEVSPGTLGILTDPSHPALASFPTENHTNWQWFPIVKSSRPMVLDLLPAAYRPIVQVIDNVERNHKLGLLFEFKVGEGRLLVCAADLRSVLDKPEARQFYLSLVRYMESDAFSPATNLTPDELERLFITIPSVGNIAKLGNISYK